MSGQAAAGPDREEILHASCVAREGRAALILGASGRGKSTLALQMMALGAGLVSDDRTVVSLEGDRLMASAPQSISGLIEARGVGILQAETVGPAQVVLAVDLDKTETARMPEAQAIEIMGQSVPLLGGVASPHFPAALLQMLACGRHQP